MGAASTYEGFSGAIALYEGERELETSCAGFADMPNRRPVDADTVFGMASGCKIFTAVGILELAGEGKLGLDEPVNRYLGDWRVGEAVTFRHLLAHRSGIADYCDEEAGEDYEALWLDRPCYRMREPGDFLPLFMRRAPKFEPDARFSYSNSGYVLLAYLAERVSGLGFPAFMRKAVFEPCGMERTGYCRLDMMPPNAATGYIDEGGNPRANIYSIPLVGGGDGGCFSSGRDMARFWSALSSGRLLGREAADLMLSVRSAETGEGDPYGLGAWLADGEEDLPFVMGFDPGVRFLSFHRRSTGRTLTIAANVECRLGPILRDWKPALAGG